MRDTLHKALKPIKEKDRFWWVNFFVFPRLLRECYDEICQLHADLSAVRESFRNEQARSENLSKIASDSRETATRAMDSVCAEKTLSANLAEELGNAKVQLQKSSETIGSLEVRTARMENECERLKSEVAKCNADLERQKLLLEREQLGHQVTRRNNTLLREFIHRTHRLDVPTRRGIKAMLANVSRLTAFLVLMIPMLLSAAGPPPPILRNPYTTNGASWSQTNIFSLSISNATSKPLTNRYKDGVLALFGLEAGSNAVLFVNGSNIVINWTGTGTGSSIATNANQFLGVPLSMKTGAFQTNMNFWSDGTNHGDLWVEGNVMPFGNDVFNLGTGASAWSGLVVKTEGVRWLETGAGTDNVHIFAPASLAATYDLSWPNAQGADGTVMTNNGSGTLGWWNATAVIAQKQFGSASLTNLANNPNVATNLLGAGAVTVTSNNAGTWTITGASTSGGSVSTQGVIVASSMTNLNFIKGTNLAHILATNTSGNVDVQVSSRWGLSNIVYVERGTDLSNLFFNARSGFTYEFDTMTNGMPGKVPVTLGDIAFPFCKLTNVNNIWLKGNGNTVLSCTNDGILFALQQCSNIYISGITFRGNKTNSTTYDATNMLIHGTVMSWGTNEQVIFENCRFESGNLFGVSMQGDGGGIQIANRDLKFLHCVFDGCGHTNTAQPSGALDGGAAAVFPDLFMSHCLINRCSRGLEVYSNGQATRNTVIRDTVFRDIFQRGIFIQQPVPFGTHGIVDGCFFSTDSTARSGGGNINISQSDGWIIQNCVFTNIYLRGINADPCIWMDPTQYGQGRDNLILNNKFSHVNHAVLFQNIHGGRISGNIFEYCTNATIQLNGDGSTVDHNYFLNCGLEGDADSAVIYCNFYAGTNCLIAYNQFARKAGTAPPSWIFLDSNQREYVIQQNVVDDSGGAVVPLQDSGVFTRLYDPFGGRGSPITMNASTNYTVRRIDVVVGVTNATTAGGAREVTLPSATELVGRTLTFFDPGRTAAGSNIQIRTVSSQVFNGLSGLTVTNISQDGAAITIFAANGGWTIFEDSRDPTMSTNANQFGAAGTVLTIKNGALLTNITVHGGAKINSNLVIQAGQSTSNAWVGGTKWFSQNSWTNHSAAAGLTNLATNIVEAHVLTNNGDAVHIVWRIKMANLVVNTQQFQIIFGSETALDTGLQPSSNSTAQADLWITRTGNTSQHVDARFEWGPGSGAPFQYTNTNFELVQTNGIDTIFQLRSAARRVGAHTNNWTRLWYDPAVR